MTSRLRKAAHRQRAYRTFIMRSAKAYLVMLALIVAFFAYRAHIDEPIIVFDRTQPYPAALPGSGDIHKYEIKTNIRDVAPSAKPKGKLYWRDLPRAS